MGSRELGQDSDRRQPGQSSGAGPCFPKWEAFVKDADSRAAPQEA